MDRNDNIARKRLSVLQLADRLGNASEACRRAGVDRTSFYQWKKCFARDGVDGLRDRAPVSKPHPQTTPADVARQIMALGLAHPAHGCNRIEAELAKRGTDVSAVTVQKILHKAGLGTSDKRGAALEVLHAQRKSLSAEQIAFLENFNPCFRERGSRPTRPGELLYLGMFFLGKFEGVGAIYVHAVVDGYSASAFGSLATTTRAETTVATVRERALPFFSARGFAVRSALSGEIGAAGWAVLRGGLTSDGIEMRLPHRDGANGFVERFRRTVMLEFSRRPFVRRPTRITLESVQREFDDWLVSYNTEPPHEGYPNYGMTPYAMLERDTQVGHQKGGYRPRR